MLGGNSRNRTNKRHGATAAACVAATVLGLTAAPVAAEVVPDFRPEQWGLESIDAEAVWESTRGEGVTVALPGPSVFEEHPDLVDNLVLNTGFGSNGDDVERGTAMAALVAAHGHGRDADGGVLGVAPDSELLALPTENDLTGAIRFAADEGAQIILLPEAGGGDELLAATESAVSAGALVVGPAGGNDDPNVLAVAGTDADGALIPDSPEAAAVELTAPGADLVTAGPDLVDTEVSGTRYAAAMAAGAAALLRSEYPQLRPEQVREAVVEGSQEGPGGLPALHLPTAESVAATTAQENPLLDEDMIEEDEGSGIPVWAWFATVGAVVLLGVLVLVVWVRRSSADPYGVKAERREADEELAAERAAEAERSPRRNQRGGRRRKPRGG